MAYASRLMPEPEPVRNPRVAYESWLAINWVPFPFHSELTKRLDEIQRQAVYSAAQQLREAGMPEAADLIDPTKERPRSAKEEA